MVATGVAQHEVENVEGKIVLLLDRELLEGRPDLIVAGGHGPAKRTDSMAAPADDSDFWDSMARKVYWKKPRKGQLLLSCLRVS